jgi:hypothetical protein
MPLVEASAKNKVKNEVADQLKKQGAVDPFAGAQELKTGTGKTAFAGVNPEGVIQAKYPSMQQVPKGYAFIPNAHYIDVPRNDVGQAEYTKAYSKQPYPKTYQEAIQQGKDINRGLGRETRAQLEAKGVQHQDMPEPTQGILEKTNNKGNKKVYVGGALGALAAIPNLVHAAQGAQEKDVQKSWGSLVQGASQFLGPLGAIGGELFGMSPEELDTLRKADKARKQPVPPPR